MSVAEPNEIAVGEEAGAPVAETPPDHVAGERRIGSINRARSLQSRISSVLTVGLLSLLAVGLLGWYYVHTIAAQSQARRSAQADSKGKAQGDTVLPALGPIEPLKVADSSAMERALGPAPEEPPEETLPFSDVGVVLG